MKFNNWINGTNQNYDDPTEFDGDNYTCDECGELLQVSEVCECLQEEEEENTNLKTIKK